MAWPKQRYLSESEAACQLKVDLRSVRELVRIGVLSHIVYQQQPLISPDAIPPAREHLHIAAGQLKPDE